MVRRESYTYPLSVSLQSGQGEVVAVGDGDVAEPGDMAGRAAARETHCEAKRKEITQSAWV